MKIGSCDYEDNERTSTNGGDDEDDKKTLG
jgi:hypothetical protein